MPRIAVEQRGLADVRPPHDGDDRQRDGRHRRAQDGVALLVAPVCARAPSAARNASTSAAIPAACAGSNQTARARRAARCAGAARSGACRAASRRARSRACPSPARPAACGGSRSHCIGAQLGAVARSRQRAHLAQQAGLDHRARSGVDARDRASRARDRARAGARGRGDRAKRVRARAARRSAGPCAATISSARMMRRASFGWMRARRIRIDARAAARAGARGSPRAARLRVLALEPLAQLGVGCAGVEQTFEKRADVEAGSARQHDDLAARLDRAVAARRASRDVAAGVVGDVGRDHVEQVVRHARALLGRRLGGADVHVAVDLHRVGVHDLAAEAHRELDRERASCPPRSARCTTTTGGRSLGRRGDGHGARLSG